MPSTRTFAEPAAEHEVRPTKLFIGGISRNTTTELLREHFSLGGRQRVLDCVAMRQPDGRPRGFGYVTLDSPAAAGRFLVEPQVIDGRVVDIKTAVPDSSAGKPKRAAAATAAPLAKPEPHLALGLDALASFHRQTELPWPTLEADCLGLLTRQRLGTGSSDWSMSADAPEFVPTTTGFQHRSWPTAGAPRSRLSSTGRLLATEPSKPAIPALTTGGLDDELATSTKPPSPTGTETVCPSDSEGCPTEPSPTVSMALPCDMERAESPPSLPLVHPSKGSAGHPIDCRRCNFFSKGRCSNGARCEFCHYSHEKRKPSRQEKRERRRLLQEQQDAGPAEDDGSWSDEDEEPAAAFQVLDACDGHVLAPPGCLAGPPGLPPPPPKHSAFLPRMPMTSASSFAIDAVPPPPEHTAPELKMPQTTGCTMAPQRTMYADAACQTEFATFCSCRTVTCHECRA